MITLNVYINFKFALEDHFPKQMSQEAFLFLCEVLFKQEGNFAFAKKASKLRNLPLYHNTNTFICLRKGNCIYYY